MACGKTDNPQNRQADNPTESVTEKPTEAPTPSPTETRPETPKPVKEIEKIGEPKTYKTDAVLYKYTEKESYFNVFKSDMLGNNVDKNTKGTYTMFSDENISIPATYDNDWSEFAQSDFYVLCKEKAHYTITFGDFIITADSDKREFSLKAPGRTFDYELTESLMQTWIKLDVVVTYLNQVHIYLNKQLVDRIDMDPYGDAVKASYKWQITCDKGDIKVDTVQIFNSGKNEKTKDVKAEPVGNAKLGLDITDKKDLVGICYTMWFNAIFGNGTSDISNYKYNVSNLLKEYEFTAEKGFSNAAGKTSNAMTKFHYWAEPAQGYYRSTDKAAHRKNLELLGAANVDFLVLDYTFADSMELWGPGSGSWETYIEGPMNALLDTIMEMRAEGKKVPYVVMWPNNYKMFEILKTTFLDQEKWKDCFVYWNDKPFVLYWYDSLKNKAETDAFADELTFRAMYGLQGEVHPGQWSYLEVDNAKTVAYDTNGNPEHMTACVATQENYMSKLDCAHGRNGGRFWNSQWKNVFAVHPKIVTITWWNEWCAQLYRDPNYGYFFTDNFNQEYSRDIEPMKGGHGDQYYKWLIEYVRAYKNHEECPELVNG